MKFLLLTLSISAFMTTGCSYFFGKTLTVASERAQLIKTIDAYRFTTMHSAKVKFIENHPFKKTQSAYMIVGNVGFTNGKNEFRVGEILCGGVTPPAVNSKVIVKGVRIEGPSRFESMLVGCVWELVDSYSGSKAEKDAAIEILSGVVESKSLIFSADTAAR